MDKQEVTDSMKVEIITELSRLRNRLIDEVAPAFQNKGSNFGAQRFVAWKKAVSSFYEESLPCEQLRFKGMFNTFVLVIKATDLETFWNNDGNRMVAYMDSLMLDIKNGEYDFTPINKDVKQVDIIPVTPTVKSKKVFIVHGHDGEVKSRTEAFLRKHGFDPIILHLKASGNKTIIEKLEHNTKDVGYGIVLYTPDDMGEVKIKATDGDLALRARQNVIFEHGYLMGLIGRPNVAAIVEGNVELPSDINGIVYIPNGAWEIDLLRELREAGYTIDPNNL
ncbi:hypothetical protein EKG38_23380 [Shewanella canadensis]|uniref:CD-NTase-associated protein 12/Pycsar effector protein TIR domain-containing protein n=1 Tax=Shewanella canadensis TaxID=271096 RepID=A0A3S0LIZ2_9GAMM|nr:nucleotide-binding protein [Shewanella canadensis]RTR36563.1 hypothetical protein EKG38_23380 [Shewanella canadensis]